MAVYSPVVRRQLPRHRQMSVLLTVLTTMVKVSFSTCETTSLSVSSCGMSLAEWPLHGRCVVSMNIHAAVPRHTGGR